MSPRPASSMAPLAFAWSVATACGASVPVDRGAPAAPGPPTGPAPSREDSSPPSSGASPPDPVTRSPVRAEPAPAASGTAVPVVEIQAPIADQVVPAARAAALSAVLDVRGPPAAPGTRLWVALDEAPPRYAGVAPRSRISVGALVADGETLGEGEHWLVAALVSPDGGVLRSASPGGRQPFAAVRFFVGVRGDRPAAPRVVLLSPHGTYHGAGVEGVRVEALLLGPGASLGRLRVVDDADRRGAVLLDRELPFEGAHPTPLALRGLPSGDFAIEVSVGDLSARRTVTVNRDLDPGEEKR